MSPETVFPESKPRDPRALNAYRHGLTGQVLVIPPAEKVAYEKHCQGIHESFEAKNAMEIDLVQSIADDRWRLHHAAAMATNIFAVGLTDPDTLTAHHEQIDTALAMARIWLERSRDLERLTLYEGRIQRRVEKNIALLRQLQKDRCPALPQAGKSNEAAIPTGAKDFPTEILHQEFVFSGPQIETSPVELTSPPAGLWAETQGSCIAL